MAPEDSAKEMLTACQRDEAGGEIETGRGVTRVRASVEVQECTPTYTAVRRVAG